MRPLQKLLRTSLCSFVLLAYISLSTLSAIASSEIVILYTNDVHTSIDSGVSYAGVAAYKKHMEEQHGEENVLLVDAGDAIQGGPVGLLTRGSAVIDLLNTVGYDYMTLGNHEFDYGIPRLLELLQKLSTKVLSCNITFTKDNSLVFTPYSIEHIRGLNIAFVGITTPETFTKSTPSFFQDAQGNYLYSFAESNKGQTLYQSVQNAVDAARAQGAEIVIALAHLGIDAESSPWTSTEVIQNTTGIDAVIDGHSHSIVNTHVKNASGQEVLLTQTGTRLQSLGHLTLDAESKKITAQLVPTITQKDATVEKLIANIQQELAVILEKSVAKTQVPLVAADTQGVNLVRLHETNLGNLVADAYRAALEADIALINGGGIRNSIDAGDITYNEIIGVLPFGNDGVSIQVTGKTILEALEMGARTLPSASGGLMHVSGMNYTVDTSVPSSVKIDDKGNFVAITGAHRVKDVLIHGKPLQLDALYSVAAASYTVLNFGDGMAMFRGAKLLKDKYMIDNEILIQFITKNLQGVVGEAYANTKGEGRIRILP